MSIYSGFATRFQQQSYDHCIDSLLYLLQKRIIKFYQNDQADEEKFINLVLKLHHQMKNMEKNKYLQPKSSQSIAQLVKFMQLFLQNTSINQDIQQERKREELPKNQSKPVILPQVANTNKKKSMFWVQKVPQPPQSNRTSSQYDKQTINKNSSNANIQQVNAQMRKTNYNPAHLRGLKVKNTSKSNLSRQENHLNLALPPKNRSKSNYMQNKHIGLTKMTHYAHSFRGQNQHDNTNRKNKSNQKINQVDYQTLNPPNNSNQNEVADIIKEYILKAKKSHLRASRHQDYRDTLTKLHDF